MQPILLPRDAALGESFCLVLQYIHLEFIPDEYMRLAYLGYN